MVHLMNIELRVVTFRTHLRKHLRLPVGYLSETSVTGSHARVSKQKDNSANSESTSSLETSIPLDFSVIESFTK